MLQIALSNLDTVLLEARGVLESIGPHLLAEMEDIQKAQFDPPCPSPGAPLVSKAHLAVLSRRPTANASGSGQLAVWSCCLATGPQSPSVCSLRLALLCLCGSSVVLWMLTVGATAAFGLPQHPAQSVRGSCR